MMCGRSATQGAIFKGAVCAIQSFSVRAIYFCQHLLRWRCDVRQVSYTGEGAGPGGEGERMVRDLQGTREAVDHKLAASRIRMFGRGGSAAADDGFDYGGDEDGDVSADEDAESQSGDESEEAGSSDEGSSGEEEGAPQSSLPSHFQNMH